MLTFLFHAWERQLASVTTDRVVGPFDWGLEWMSDNGRGLDATATGGVGAFARSPEQQVGDWIDGVMADTDTFFTPPPTTEYRLTASGDGTSLLTFPSAFTTPHPENNTVYC